MNITKPKTSLKKVGEKVGDKCKETFSRKNLKRNLIVLASVAIVGGAVYLNWSYFSDEGESGIAGAHEVVVASCRLQINFSVLLRCFCFGTID